MKNDSASQLGGQIFMSMLTVLLIGLKLTGQIDQSWWWVLSPFWIPAVLVLVVLLIALMLGAGRK